MLSSTRDKIMPFKNLPLKVFFRCINLTVLRLTVNCKTLFVFTSNSKIYGKVPRYNETSLLPNFIPRGSLAIPAFPGLFKFPIQNGLQNRGYSKGLAYS